MILAKVIGTLVAPVRTRSHQKYKTLVVRSVDFEGNTHGQSFIALDVAQAGVGDYVLVLREGNSIRQIMKDDQGAVEALIVGVVDYITVDGEQRDLMDN